MVTQSRFTPEGTLPTPSPDLVSPADYLAMVGHDLRTPLTVIKGYAGIMRNPALSLDEERRAAYARRIADAADHLACLIDGLLTAGRGSTADLQPCRRRVDLAELISAAVARARDLGRSHRIHAIVPRAPVLLDIDPEMVERVLDNLRDNARKYSPEGGDISAGVRIVEQSPSVEGVPRPGAARPRRWAILWVRDQGIGIPRDQVRFVFERYARIPQPSTADVPGTGLGLYICERIIRAHDGRIWVVSEPGRGSVFYVGLPGVQTPSPDDGRGA